MASIRKRGEYQWEARIRRKGYPIQAKTFSYKADAEAWAADVEARMAKGAYRDHAVAEDTTLKEVLHRYQEEVFSSLADGGRGDQARLDRLVERLGDYALAHLEGHHIAAYRDERLSEHAAPQTVKHELGLLGRVMRHAQGEWGVPFPHGMPTTGIRQPKLPQGRDRRLLPSEEERLLKGCQVTNKPELAIAIILAIETALRRSELFELRWELIDLQAQTARIPSRAKTEDRATIPLSRRAVEAFKSHPNYGGAESGRIWTWRRSDNITQSFGRLLKHLNKKAREAREKGEEVAEIEDLHWHDLRHEATSRFFEATNLSQMEIAAITGHHDTATLSRYTHLRAGDLAKRLG